MKVFLTGGSGVIGHRLILKLLEAGHQVVAMTRSESGALRIRQADADPVICDVFDLGRLREAVSRARPEVVVHQLTSIPPRINPRRVAREMLNSLAYYSGSDP